MLKLALLNISRRKKHVLLILLISVLSLTSFSFLFMSSKLVKEGLDNMISRLGADIVVVPGSGEIDIDNLLFTGNPETSYMSIKVLDELRKIDGIEKVTEQFFTATIEGAGCCGPDQSIRIVGINTETDFILSPWFEEENISGLKENEIIAGADIPLFLGNQIALLGDVFTLKGNLYSTGTGMDETIFMDMSEAKRLSISKFKDELWEEDSIQESISSVLIKVKDEEDPDELLKEINAIGDIRAYSTSESISQVRKQIEIFSKILYGIITVLILISIISILTINTFAIKMRTGEIGYLRSIGFQKKQVFSLFFIESTITFLIAVLISTSVGWQIVKLFLETYKEVLILPKSVLSTEVLIKSGILNIVLVEILALLSTIIPLKKLSKYDLNDIMERGMFL